MNPMETRVAVLGIIVDDIDATAALNKILHRYADYVIGRMGIPYPKRKISIISVAIEASQEVISAMAGKIGRLAGVSCKTAYSNHVYSGECNAARE